MGIIALTAVYAVPHLGREFMPELEEGNLYDPRHVPGEHLAGGRGRPRRQAARS